MAVSIKRITLVRLLFSVIVFASCSKEEIKRPTAAFSYNSDNGFISPTSISFINESTGAERYTWDFGDGSPISNNINPIHIYQEPGTYKVYLIAANGNRLHQVDGEISVFALPAADFAFTSDNDFKVGSIITFENRSLNSETYQWDFGDGTTSTEENPVHIYDEPATYTVQLTATNIKGNDVITSQIIITALETEEQMQLEKLKGSWPLASATVDGDNRTDDFQNLVLTLSGNYVEGGEYIYSFAGTRPDPSPWPPDGDWMFGNPKTTQMIRDPNSADEIPMTYVVTDSNLTISFEVSDGGGWAGGSSRVVSVTGEWIFTFTK